MSEKKSVRIPISNKDKLITFELTNDIDLLEILSLKFTQTDVYSSGLCSDYGVVAGRVTANNGYGIPNAKVSIFIPLNINDEIDPVISKLYPYKQITDKDDNGYRYNLLPKRKQHGGHEPSGTFFDQEEILTNEEYLEVFEKYYNYTVKTNESGDFMIWGVPIGKQTIHIDVDLSDIGCFSLRPYDFIRKGVGEDNFSRTYKFKSSTDIDGLPQIITYNKDIEVFPFIGNEELCQIGISRVDFDLSDANIKIEPISLILMSSVTDDNDHAVGKWGAIKTKSGYKCNLQTTEGIVECVRFTGNKVYGTDGDLYPELEFFNVTETIDENGVAMVVIPMNLDYTYTNEFGEQVVTNDKNKGIPTNMIGRFRYTLQFNDSKIATAKYLVPNIREFSNEGSDNVSFNEYDPNLLTTYLFSDVFEDYIRIPSGYTSYNAQMSDTYMADKKSLMLNVDPKTNELIPKDYFYKFIYGKVYTVSSFQGSHFENENKKISSIPIIGSIFKNRRKDSFLGIKEIRPNNESDCSSNANYFPTNFAFKNRTQLNVIIAEILLYLQYIFVLVTNWVNETTASYLMKAGRFLGPININYIVGSTGFIFFDTAKSLINTSYSIIESGQQTLPLTFYPDCDECNRTDELENGNVDFNIYNRSAEIKTKVIMYSGGISSGVYLVFNSGQTISWVNSSTTLGTSFLGTRDSAKEVGSTLIYETDLLSLDTNMVDGTPINKYIGDVYYNNNENNFTTTFKNSVDTQYITSNFEMRNVSLYTINYFDHVKFNSDNSTFYYHNNEVMTNAPENILILGICLIYVPEVSSPAYDDYKEPYEYPIYHTFTISGGTTSTTAENNGHVFNKINDVKPLNSSISIYYTYEDWHKYIKKDIILNGSDMYIRLYDASSVKSLPIATLETGCDKYDKFYNETDNQYKFIWGPGEYNGTNYKREVINHFISGYGEKATPTSMANAYEKTTVRESDVQPVGDFKLLSTISGSDGTFRLPNKLTGDLDTIFNKKTKSGLTEIRDGVFTIVPVIEGKNNNTTVIQEWYRRKRIGLLFCSGVINYSFIDNWLNGMLYFFKFKKRILWDSEENLDLNVRGSQYPRELVFFNIFDNNFYYRSTPYVPNVGFVGKGATGSNKELLHPTTFYDVGVRDEFLKEICFDPRVDPTCSVIRDITPTSYQDPAYIMEYGINYRMDISGAKTTVEDFFTGKIYGDNAETLDGDLTQLMSINNEAGIEAFDLNNSYYFMYNGELLDPEGNNSSYFSKKEGNKTIWGPTPIDLKFDWNGSFIRGCLNSRLGDYTQTVPFYLWNKGGEGFGPYGDNSDKQSWDRQLIASMPLQKMYSINNVGETATNYLMPDTEEEYLLKPMTIEHGRFMFKGNTVDTMERFDIISTGDPSYNQSYMKNFVEGDLYLKVTSGTIKDPLTGIIYVMKNQTWEHHDENNAKDYIIDDQESFIFETAKNYSGNKQVLSTPFLFYFGLRPQKTALDMLIKYYGPKGAFPNAD